MGYEIRYGYQRAYIVIKACARYLVQIALLCPVRFGFGFGLAFMVLIGFYYHGFGLSLGVLAEIFDGWEHACMV